MEQKNTSKIIVNEENTSENILDKYIDLYKKMYNSKVSYFLMPDFWDIIFSNNYFLEIEKFWENFEELFTLQLLKKPTNIHDEFIINIVKKIIVFNKFDIENNLKIFFNLNKKLGMFYNAFNDDFKIFSNHSLPKTTFTELLENNIKDVNKKEDNIIEILKLNNLPAVIKSDITNLLKTDYGMLEFIFAIDMLPLTFELVKGLY